MHYKKIPIIAEKLEKEMVRNALKTGLWVWAYVHSQQKGKPIDNIYYRAVRNGFCSLKSLSRFADRGVKLESILSKEHWELVKKVLPLKK